jgi:hypothetical protein
MELAKSLKTDPQLHMQIQYTKAQLTTANSLLKM